MKSRKRGANEELNDEEKEEAEEQEKNKRKGLFYREVDFADDSDAYVQRVSRKDRIEYWRELVNKNKEAAINANALQSENKETWVEENRTNFFELELRKYPAYKVFFLYILTSGLWDYAYLIALILWLILVSLKLDSFSTYLDSLPNLYVLGAPLAIMFICQLLPVAGVMYFIPCCNDLTRFIATKYFGFWVRLIFLFEF